MYMYIHTCTVHVHVHVYAAVCMDIETVWEKNCISVMGHLTVCWSSSSACKVGGPGMHMYTRTMWSVPPVTKYLPPKEEEGGGPP